MDNDDEIKGRVWTRREVLSLLGGLGAAMVVACTNDDGDSDSPSTTTASGSTPEATATTASTTVSASPTALPSCIVTPELTEGPYFLDEQLDRSDIRSDPGGAETREGVELTLTLNVLSVGGASCSPMSEAVVDVWHCDALGAYSGFNDNAQGFQTVGEKWLRGYQTTDANGQVKFTTIYPGWYQGRATHIHFKVRKGNEEFTSQFFFDDALSDEVHANDAPYSERGATGRLQNSRDNIYQQSNGMLLLNVEKSGNGYAATFDIGVQS